MSVGILISQDTTYISLPDAFINQLYYNSDLDVNQECNGCMCPVGEPMFETPVISYPDWLDTVYVSFFPDTSNYSYYGGSYQLIVTGTPLVEDIGNNSLILHEYISYDLWYDYYDNTTWNFSDVYIIDLNIYTSITFVSKASFKMTQIIKRNNDIIVSAAVHLVTVNNKGKPIKIVDILKKKLILYLI